MKLRVLEYFEPEPDGSEVEITLAACSKIDSALAEEAGEIRLEGVFAKYLIQNERVQLGQELEIVVLQSLIDNYSV